MKITTVGDVPTVQRQVKIENGPVVPCPTSRTGKLMRAEDLTVGFLWKGFPDEWVAQEVDLGGRILKKDGSDSLNLGMYIFSLTGWFRPAPDWVREIVEQIRPDHIPNMWSGSTETGDPSDG